MGLMIEIDVKVLKNEKTAAQKVRRFSRGRGIRTPMDGFGDRNTAIV